MIALGWLYERPGADGMIRYVAMYRDLKGRKRSAGTYASEKLANQAWQDAESNLRSGRRVGDPRRGRMKFKDYVQGVWLPHHEMEVTTRQKYTYALNKHILKEFGLMRMVDVMPEDVRAWVTKMKGEGVSAVTIKSNMVILSAIFTTALNDQVTFLHPCKGVKTPPAPSKPLTIISPEQFSTLYDALPDADTQLLVETAIETGARWGELTELRAKDLDTRSRILTICRAVVEVNPKFHPDGERFLVKPYPKDKEWRRFKLTAQIVDKLTAHAESEGLGRDDLFFTWRQDPTPKRKLLVVPDPDTLGFTEPNEAGRRYKHGTLTAYTTGKCRCEHCRATFAIYRSTRRKKGKDKPRQPRLRDTDGHIPADWFRNHVWKPAIKAASLAIAVRIHDLRHAHASWLLSGGADLQVVKERLGHGSIKTTERYLHTLDDADETALDAFTKIRNRKKTS